MKSVDRVALIIGHRGQDGTLLRQRLEADGVRAVGIGRPRSGPESLHRDVDVTDAAAMERLVQSIQPTEVYYLAAQHGSSETTDCGSEVSRESWKTHVTGFETVLDVIEASREPAKVLLASSSLIYEPSNDLIDENAPLRPDSVYGITKAAAMLLARERRRNGVPVFTAVLFPHESGLRPETFIASKIVRAGLRIAAGSSERIAIAHPDAVIDWSMAEDVVDAIIGLVRDGTPDDYIFASGRPTTVQELIDATSRHLQVSIIERVDIAPQLLLRPHARRVGNPKRLMSSTAWQPTQDIDAFVERLVASHRIYAPVLLGPSN